ncbi:MAG: two-component system LytT family sensor kinase [Colwellia sp.]|jgi:two-component system LytT family sensor kinase
MIKEANLSRYFFRQTMLFFRSIYLNIRPIKFINHVRTINMLNSRKHIRSTLIIHTFIWLLSILLMGVLITLIERSNLPREMYFHGHLWFGIMISMLNVTMFYWLYFYLNRATKRVSRYSILFNITLVITGAVFVSTSADIYLFSLNFEESQFQFLWDFIAFNCTVKFYFALIATFTRFSVDWINQLAARNATQLEIMKTELAILKSQTNPHFLFNTLNALYASSYQFGDVQTATGISNLSHLLRYMLFHNSKERVNIQQEIEHIESYIVLQKQRHHDNIKVEFIQALSLQFVEIAPMLLMPLVENAFKYGIKPNDNNRITFNIVCSNNKLVFTSQNVDHSILYKNHEHVTKNGFGLDNLKKRLNILYPQQHKLITSIYKGHFITELEIICF